MKQLMIVAGFLCLTLSSFAQVDSTKNETDTLAVGGMVIIRAGSDGDTVAVATKKTLKNVTTNWGGVDLGFNNYVDNTVYGPGTAADLYAPGSNGNWFDLQNGKSVNVNIWIVSQRVNLIKHVVNLKYSLGLELNNYRYKQNIRYTDDPAPTPDPAIVTLDQTVDRDYRKNKLAADYLTVPVMLNFNFTPGSKRNFGFSAGVSAGYLYASRNKTITSDQGKQKSKDDFELNRFKLAYVGELSLGVIRLYGTYATKSMYSRGLDMTPYSVGIRLGNWLD